jgi:formate dehydrogenase
MSAAQLQQISRPQGFTACRPSSTHSRPIRQRASLRVYAALEKQKVVAVLYQAGDAAKNKDLLGCVENELGLRKFLEDQGHEFVVTSDKEGENSELEKHLEDADILISTPFHPAYLTKERIQKAKNLKLSITAGVGSDHVDLHAAADAGMTVTEVSGSNVVSVAEHVVMLILALVRNFLFAHKQIVDGGWDIGAVAAKAYDLENKIVGVVGAGRIGQLTLERLKPFALKELLYFDYKRLPEEKEKAYNCKFTELEDLVKKCDAISILVPLTDKTRNLFDKEVIGKMKKGSYLINTARGGICERDAVVDALESGQLAGYAGDVWNPQPPGDDHPWRRMPNNGMTAHYSGTTLDAQKRYAEGTKEILQCWIDEKPIRDDYYIVREGELAPQYK